MKSYNYIIVGSGISALQLANELTDDSRVLIVTKSMKHSSNSYRAQGGIAAAVGNEDTASTHYKDTIAAGCNFHNERSAGTCRKWLLTYSSLNWKRSSLR